MNVIGRHIVVWAHNSGFSVFSHEGDRGCNDRGRLAKILASYKGSSVGKRA